jgi:hypothetical protein
MGLLIRVLEPHLSKQSKKIVKNIYGGVLLWVDQIISFLKEQ